MSRNGKSSQRKYYHDRLVLDESIRRITRRLSLVISEEEDAEAWLKYKAVMCSYRRLELEYGHEDRLNNAMWQREYYKPVFDETYLTLTFQLRGLYESKARQNTDEIRDQIKQVYQLRQKTATFVKRDAAETAFEAAI